MWYNDVMNPNKPILIVGLGNPGAKYARTRHNAGFIAVDILAGADTKWQSAHKSLVTKLSGRIYAKPQTFMNLSGQAVQSLMTFYRIPLENLIVIHDDMDLKLGDVRQKTGGGSAGHNGIKSIDAAIGNGYRRIRIGIGRFDEEKGKNKNGMGFLSMLFGSGKYLSPSDWVLGKFSDEEMKIISGVVEKLEI